MKEISRKKFLRTLGAAVTGGTVVGVSGTLLSRKGRIVSPVAAQPDGNAAVEPTSPWRRTVSFAVPGRIRSFEWYGDDLYVATDDAIHVFDPVGKALRRFAVASEVRDLAAGVDGLYVLYPSRVEVRLPGGKCLRTWEACDDGSDYCALAVGQGFVFVTDAAHKHICKYATEGRFVGFIRSPEVFIIPSLTFGIACTKGVLYCSNSGRHRIERYTLDGEYLGAFGQPGSAPGCFAGCCNPVHLSHTSGGELITSEKGEPRISCYGGDGVFRGVLLDSRMLGGGHAAYDVKLWNDRLYVAGNRQITAYRLDKTHDSTIASTCTGCALDCGLNG